MYQKEMRDVDGVADVAVVGGGPAGARAAWVLARGGALALVGEAIRLDCSDRTAIRRARFVIDNGGRSDDAVVPLDDDALVVVSRATFDHALLAAAESAGAAVERIRVRDVAIEKNG